MTDTASVSATQLDRNKFRDPDFTADGKPRARVAFSGLETLWFNTGTLCNLTCFVGNRTDESKDEGPGRSEPSARVHVRNLVRRQPSRLVPDCTPAGRRRNHGCGYT